jgi:hypothetical protein
LFGQFFIPFLRIIVRGNVNKDVTGKEGAGSLMSDMGDVIAAHREPEGYVVEVVWHNETECDPSGESRKARDRFNKRDYLTVLKEVNEDGSPVDGKREDEEALTCSCNPLVELLGFSHDGEPDTF